MPSTNAIKLLEREDGPCLQLQMEVNVDSSANAADIYNGKGIE